VVLPAAPKARELSLFDGAGRRCLNRSFGPNETKLDLSSLPPGLYLLRISGPGVLPTQQRLVITR
jgi:hypothetical protein